MVSELSNELFAVDVQGKKVVASISVLPGGKTNLKDTAAIRMSGDGKRVYVSTRTQDILSVLVVDGPSLSLEQTVRCGKHPRDFILWENHLLVAERDSDRLVSYALRDGCIDHQEDSVTVPEGIAVVMEEQSCVSYVSSRFVDPEEMAHYQEATSLEIIVRELELHNTYVATYHRKEDKRVICEQINYNWLDKANGEILVTRTNVTTAYEREQKQLREIDEARQVAEKASHSKEEFLSRISHDIRTPISAIIGMVAFADKDHSSNYDKQTMNISARVDTNIQYASNAADFNVFADELKVTPAFTANEWKNPNLSKVTGYAKEQIVQYLMGNIDVKTCVTNVDKKGAGFFK